MKASRADRSEAQLPAAGKPRQTSETISKRSGPSNFCQRWGRFRRFEITKNSEPSIAPQAAARPMQPKLRAADYRYCGS